MLRWFTALPTTFRQFIDVEPRIGRLKIGPRAPILKAAFKSHNWVLESDCTISSTYRQAPLGSGELRCLQIWPPFFMRRKYKCVTVPTTLLKSLGNRLAAGIHHAK